MPRKSPLAGPQPASHRPATAAPGGKSAGSLAAATDPAWAIARAEDERNWSDGVLRGLLASSDATLRARAALAVGRLQDSTTVPALLPLLDDGDPRVREETVFALGQIGHRSARAALEKLLPGAEPGLAALAIEALGKIGVSVTPPRATIYIWAPVPGGRTSASFAEAVLEETAVVVGPGSMYGPSGEGFFRISLTCPDERLTEAVERMRRHLA